MNRCLISEAVIWYRQAYGVQLGNIRGGLGRAKGCRSFPGGPDLVMLVWTSTSGGWPASFEEGHYLLVERCGIVLVHDMGRTRDWRNRGLSRSWRPAGPFAGAVPVDVLTADGPYGQKGHGLAPVMI